MTISPTHAMNAIAETKIDPYWVGYFRETLRGEIYELMVEAFDQSELTKADLARKLGRRPEQITRWLSAPSNLESDTLSDILLALGLRPVVHLKRIEAEPSNQQQHPFAARLEGSATELSGVYDNP
jgi:DNA-binding phage protein